MLLHYCGFEIIAARVIVAENATAATASGSARAGAGAGADAFAGAGAGTGWAFKVFWQMQKWYTHDARNASVCLECCNGANP